MPIFITSSVFKLEKGYLYQNGAEFHQQSNGIGGATVPPRWCHFFSSPTDNTTEFGQGGATRY